MKTIVIDAGGVLFSNLTPRLWQELAKQSAKQIEANTLYLNYKQEISSLLWTGEYTETQFWSWLEQHDIFLNVEERQALISSCLLPLPAYYRIATWSKHANLILMSNHLTSWISPALQQIESSFTHSYISSEIKLKKPSVEWFELIEQAHPTNEPKLFVDDHPANLAAAKQAVGWNTLLADSEHHWMDELERYIMCNDA